VTRGRVHQINVSRGGVPKRPVPAADVTRLGLAGDAQRDTAHHGGPERAVCLYSLDLIERLRAEGHPIVPGAVGENVTLDGLIWADIVPGSRLHFDGGVVVEVASYTRPCAGIREAFTGLKINRIWQQAYPGWSRVYARVVVPGRLRTGEGVCHVGAPPAPTAGDAPAVT
jgi:MOSC domain-containing protein YiiM